MGRTIYKEVKIDVEIEIELDDVLAFIKETKQKDLEKISKALKIPNKKNINILIETNFDVMKVELFQEYMDKYNLQELERRLK